MAGLPTLSYPVGRNPRLDLEFEGGGSAFWRLCRAKVVG
jgi:hypothetical protein